jgi:hypothetical protein
MFRADTWISSRNMLSAGWFFWLSLQKAFIEVELSCIAYKTTIIKIQNILT